MPDPAPRPVDRQPPTDEARDLIALVRDVARREIAPDAAEEEDAGRLPRELFGLLSESGLLGLPYDVAHGGGGRPYEVHLQVLEELAMARLTVGLGVSVHTLACHAPAMAKLLCADGAMKVTTDAVQVLGGYGCTADFPAERYLCEAKALQIVEGANRIQRMVIARHPVGPGTG
ncbi:acyl-CoA dehydrogenase family protein [Streptomyces sp. NPDC002698]|uniref:acyl-CoA dehydrogenase family protein n=1 Tax=Streptomyces sp. NPDC002698 TaxID=3364660 RepID=UPI0036B11E2C